MTADEAALHIVAEYLPQALRAVTDGVSTALTLWADWWEVTSAA